MLAEDYPELLREIVFSRMWQWGKVRQMLWGKVGKVFFNVINIVEQPLYQGNSPGRQRGAKHPSRRWRVQLLRSRKERSL